ncbi:hypothetical protein N0O92_18620 [Alkalihalobacillus sp. MEB130]|uniref:hypothetical protein n=1 Tax=Alkalihalobacillus sp. MEB130 TaxID=2976704 RepID=UPI0028E0690B|nr:hypothetical protein [Alkalihalobacillus sp. MEB130]MDT8862228.1 hypothetical protein [Alkalihalobacillus sp. MEB130]
MTIISLFKDTCPTCKQTLKHDKSEALIGRIVKHCPEGHYEKEYHPALETFVETIRN